MLIKNMFKKPIDRNIQGVIVVGEEGLTDEKNELEEYVVTRELQRHFKEFFENYKVGVLGKTRKNGVWISGFFGSGKSHFLKMLSYLLENKLVAGKPTLDYFKEDNKIQDSMVMADIQLSVDTPTKVILFNIDSKSEQTSKQSKDAIVNVFLKVFNEMQGFYGARPAIADLERNLTEDGCYEAFQTAFLEESGHEWKQYRHRFNFEFVHVAKALAAIKYQNLTVEAATSVCQNIMMKPFQLSIEGFARLVRDWCDKQGKNQHLIFCVDEVGQYIGDDSQMMLNLQTMREELGKECQGRAWVIVTSQQDVDSIMEMTARKGTDFSKIQGRFDTRLSLSSANVDEVIKKRLLSKTETAEQTLRLLYDDKAVSIKNKIKFEKTPEMKLYDNRDVFAEIYPFIPYQFNLLGKVLNSIRTHGASGKHLSEGERSMLALFKKAAERLQNKDDGALVPFYMFYDALENFLDAVHSRVISQALDNKNINPSGDRDCFAVNVLKVLFLVKYVKEFQATTIANITSLMVTHVDADIYELQKQVEAALKVLIKETLVQEHSGNYVFLTEEEQEIGREIDRQNVEIGEIQNKVSDLVFNDLYPEAKYKYNAFNGRYTFWFNQLVDDRPHKNNQNYDIGVHVLTPYFTDYDEHTLNAMSGEGKQVLVVLPASGSCFSEINQYLKIEKYLQHNPLTKSDRFAPIKEAKSRELRERMENAKLYLQESLRNADIYVNGSKSEIGAKDITARINEALGKLVNTVYNKLNYIDTAMSSANILGMLRNDKQGTLALGSASVPNHLALDDCKRYIERSTSMHNKISLKTIKDYFAKPPYGFITDDVEWLVAKLFKDGDLGLQYQQENVTLNNTEADKIVEYLTKKGYVDKIMVDLKPVVPKAKIKTAKDVAKDLFGYTIIATDTDRIMSEFQRETASLLSKFQSWKNNFYDQNTYPGAQTVMAGIKLLQVLKSMDNTMEFFNYVVTNEDELEELAGDYLPIKEFFEGEQKKFFDKALEKLKIYDDSQCYIADNELEDLAKSMQKIVNAKTPYGMIRQLPELMDKFDTKYLEILEANTEPVRKVIIDNQKFVMDILATKPYKSQYESSYSLAFEQLLAKAEHSNNILLLRSFSDQANALMQRKLLEMEKLDAELKPKKENEGKNNGGNSPEGKGAGGSGTFGNNPPETETKKKKQVIYQHANVVVPMTTWHIETEADVDKYCDLLRGQLKKLVREDIIYNIKF